MLDTISNTIASWTSGLGGVASTAIAALAILALAALIAFLAHETFARIIARVVSDRSHYVTSFLAQARPVTRLTFVIIALGLVLPAVPLGAQGSGMLGRALLLTATIAIGWLSLIALKLASDLYLTRYQSETTDIVVSRKHITQVRVLHRAAATLVVIVTVCAALMTFDAVREFGVSLFASAGVASIVVGLAARPVLSNLLAGVTLAITQPIRIEDSVYVEGEFGTIEEIGSAYVLIKIWDKRRMLVPLTYFLEKPFQNWTRQGTALMGTAMFYLDYTAPVERIRTKIKDVVTASPLWDGETLTVQVTDIKPDTIELRVVVGAPTPSACFELRTIVRERVIDFLQREIPHALPRRRSETAITAMPEAAPQPLDGKSAGQS